MMWFDGYLLHEHQYGLDRRPVRFAELGTVFSLPDKTITNPWELPTDLPLDDTYIVPDGFGDNDHSPSSTARANREVFLARFGDEEGVCLLTGHFNAAGVAISLQAYLDNEEMQEMLGSLKTYPFLDDEVAARIGVELRVQHWNLLLYGRVCRVLADFEHPLCHDRPAVLRQSPERVGTDLEEFFDDAFGRDPDDGDPRPLQMRIFDEVLADLEGYWAEGSEGLCISLDEADVATELAHRLTDGDFDELRTDGKEVSS